MLPLIVHRDLTDGQKKNFEQRFGYDPAWDRSVRENVWRRHQDPENSDLSGWVPGDHRRRLVHFRDRYGLVGDDFCLVETYLFVSIKAPLHEIEEYKSRISERNLCGLKLEVVEKRVREEDLLAGRHTPENYSNLDIRLFSHDYDERTASRPWRVFNTGIRRRIPRGNPTVTDSLKDFFPVQVELGCGPSIEVGIPPLNFFHGIFSLSKDGKFVFRAEDDMLLSVFDDPESWYRSASLIHKKTLLAEPSEFYLALKELHDSGAVVGPILNNNFDGLPLGVGLEEFSLRTYDDEGSYPPLKFHPDAKSLLVIGSHADRRKCQQHAREAGLKVVYMDPEGYMDAEGHFIPYPLESPQTGEYLIRRPARELKNCL